MRRQGAPGASWAAWVPCRSPRRSPATGGGPPGPPGASWRFSAWGEGVGYLGVPGAALRPSWRLPARPWRAARSIGIGPCLSRALWRAASPMAWRASESSRARSRRSWCRECEAAVPTPQGEASERSRAKGHLPREDIDPLESSWRRDGRRPERAGTATGWVLSEGLGSRPGLRPCGPRRAGPAARLSEGEAGHPASQACGRRGAAWKGQRSRPPGQWS